MSRRSDERGSTLVLTLVFMALFGVLVATLLAFGDTGLRLHDVQEANTNKVYSADNAVEWATKSVQDNRGICTPELAAGKTLDGSTIALPDDVSSVTVTCQQYTGPGSNTFGGYSVIAGTKYAEYLRSKGYGRGFGSNCDSFSTDPVGNAFGKKGKEGDRCRTFPVGAAPAWTPIDPPAWADDSTETFAGSWNDKADDDDPTDAFWAWHGFMDAQATDSENWWYSGSRTKDWGEPFVYWGGANDEFFDFTGVKPASGPNPSLTGQSNVKSITKVWANRRGIVDETGGTRFDVWAVSSNQSNGSVDKSSLWHADLETEAVTDDPAAAAWSRVSGLEGNPDEIFDVFGWDNPGGTDKVWVLGRYGNQEAVWIGDTTAGTTTWSRQDLPGDKAMRAGWSPDGVNVFVVGDQKTWHFPTVVGTGFGWGVVASPENADLWDIDGYVDNATTPPTISAYAVALDKKKVYRLTAAATGTWAVSGDVLGDNGRSLIALDTQYRWFGPRIDKATKDAEIFRCPVNPTEACPGEAIDPDWDIEFGAEDDMSAVAGAAAPLLKSDGSPLLNPDGTAAVAANFMIERRDTNGNFTSNKRGAPITYTPVFPQNCGETCKAYISGGPLFNAMDVNLASKLDARPGFQQMENPTNPSSCADAPPTNLPRANLTPTGMWPDGAWWCQDAVPTKITDLGAAYTLPSAVPKSSPTNGGKAGNPISGLSGTGANTCSNLKVWFPGTYPTKVKFPRDTYNFLVSGVYNFAGGFQGIDNGKESAKRPNALYIVGGEPSFGDDVTYSDPRALKPENELTVTERRAADCWTLIEQSGFCPVPADKKSLCAATDGTGRSGTGVELIFSKKTKWDVKTANIELFTRIADGDPTRPNGLSIRESCREEDAAIRGTMPRCPASWAAYQNTAGDRLMLKVKKKDRQPQIYIHGGIYMPSHNIQEVTTTRGVILGSMFANSIELAFTTVTSPAAQISAGSNLRPTVILTATTTGNNPHSVQVIVPFAPTSRPVGGRYTGQFGVFRLDDARWNVYKAGWGRGDTRSFAWRLIKPLG